MMGPNQSGFPDGRSPEESETIRQAALELLNQDRHFDDAIFTPLGAIGVGMPNMQPEGITQEAATRVADRTTKEALELLQRDEGFDDNDFTPPGAA